MSKYALLAVELVGLLLAFVGLAPFAETWSDIAVGVTIMLGGLTYTVAHVAQDRELESRPQAVMAGIGGALMWGGLAACVLGGRAGQWSGYATVAVFAYWFGGYVLGSQRKGLKT